MIKERILCKDVGLCFQQLKKEMNSKRRGNSWICNKLLTTERERNMEDPDVIPEEDTNIPIIIDSWGPHCVIKYNVIIVQLWTLLIIVSSNQRADIANLFIHCGTYPSALSLASNLPLPPHGYPQSMYNNEYTPISSFTYHMYAISIHWWPSSSTFYQFGHEWDHDCHWLCFYYSKPSILCIARSSLYSACGCGSHFWCKNNEMSFNKLNVCILHDCERRWCWWC